MSYKSLAKTAFANNTFRQIRLAARPFYLLDGPNQWQHIQEVRRRAQKMMRKLLGRSLTPALYAAVLLHDNTKRLFGGLNHGRMGAERARKILAGILAQKDIDLAATAISVHDDNLKKFPSHTAELLASADANPPLEGWLFNKSYNYAIRHGLKGNDRYAHIVEQVPPKYGLGGKFNYPSIYNLYYGDKVTKFKKNLSQLTLLKAKLIVQKYRDKYGIKEDLTKVIHNV